MISRCNFQDKEMAESSFETTICCAPCNVPGEFVKNCFCTCCIAVKNRKHMLNGDWSSYLCCDGAFPCTKCREVQSCPRLCACLELFICPGCFVSTNRLMAMDRYRLEPNGCDTLCIWANNCCQMCVCCCNEKFTKNVRQLQCVGEYIADFLDCIGCICGDPNDENSMRWAADCCFCMLFTCMTTQTNNEIRKREKNMSSPSAVVVKGFGKDRM